MARGASPQSPVRLLIAALAACLLALILDVWARSRVGEAAAALTVARRERATALDRRNAADRAYRRDLQRAAAIEHEVHAADNRLAATAIFKDGDEAGRAFLRDHPEAQVLTNDAWRDLANSWPRAAACAAGFSPQQTEAAVALFQRQKGQIPTVFGGIKLTAENGGDLGVEAQTTMLENLVGHDLYEKYRQVVDDRSAYDSALVYAATADAGEPLTLEQMQALRKVMAASTESGRAFWTATSQAAAGILSPSQLKALDAMMEIYPQ